MLEMIKSLVMDDFMVILMVRPEDLQDEELPMNGFLWMD